MISDKIRLRAIILAGGKGSRLGNLTKKIPKPLIKIKNKEFLTYLIEYLKKNKVEEFIITTSYKNNLFNKYLKKKKFKKTKLIYEKEELGTGGSFLNVLKKTKYKKKFYTILCNADTLTLFSIDSIYKKIIQYGNSILAVKKENCKRYGRLKIKGNNIVDIERNNSKRGLISSGMFFFKKIDLKIFDKKSKKLDFEKDILKKMINNKIKIKYIKSNKPFIDIGIPEDLKRAKKFIIKNL